MEEMLLSSDFRVRVSGFEELAKVVEKDPRGVASSVRAKEKCTQRLSTGFSPAVRESVPVPCFFVCHVWPVVFINPTYCSLVVAVLLLLLLFPQPLVVADMLSRGLGDANTKVVRGGEGTAASSHLGPLPQRGGNVRFSVGVAVAACGFWWSAGGCSPWGVSAGPCLP